MIPSILKASESLRLRIDIQSGMMSVTLSVPILMGQGALEGSGTFQGQEGR